MSRENPNKFPKSSLKSCLLACERAGRFNLFLSNLKFFSQPIQWIGFAVKTVYGPP